MLVSRVKRVQRSDLVENLWLMVEGIGFGVERVGIVIQGSRVQGLRFKV